MLNINLKTIPTRIKIVAILTILNIIALFIGLGFAIEQPNPLMITITLTLIVLYSFATINLLQLKKIGWLLYIGIYSMILIYALLPKGIDHGAFLKHLSQVFLYHNYLLFTFVISSQSFFSLQAVVVFLYFVYPSILLLLVISKYKAFLKPKQ